MNNYQKVRTTVLNKTRLVTPKSKEDATVIIRTLLDLFLFESKVQKEHLLESITIFTSSPEAVKEHCAAILWSYKYSFIKRDYFSTLLEALSVLLNSSQIEWVKFYFAASDYQSDDLRENIDIDVDIDFGDSDYHYALLPSFQSVSSIVDSKIDDDMIRKLKKMEIAINPVNEENILKWARLFKENYIIWKNDDKYRKYIGRVLDIHLKKIGVYINPKYHKIINLRSQFNKKQSGTTLEILSADLSLTTVGYKELTKKKRHSIYLPESLLFLGFGIINLEEVEENIDFIDDGNQAWGESILEDIYLREATDWARKNGYNVD